MELEKEATGGMERVEATAQMEMIAGHKRLAAGQAEVNEEPKRPRDDDEEEKEMMADLVGFRIGWANMWSDYYGSVDKRTELGPMQFTNEPVPSYAKLEQALQIYSIKVMELKMCWPVYVFGSIAVRDSVDRNLNFIFERSRENCQMLTEKDSSLVLTGPSRVIQLIDPVTFEIELRAKGARPSEDKLLSAEVFEYDFIARLYRAGSLLKDMVSGPRSTLEFKFAHILSALEATIKVWIAEGSTDFNVKFVARTASIDEIVTLLDSRDASLTLSHDGCIDLSRNVVAVEGRKGQLIIGVEARQRGDKETSSVYKEASFIPAKSGVSQDTVDVGFCKMNVVVAWSLLV